MKNKDELVANITQNKAKKWGFVIELGVDPFTNKRKQKTSFRYKSKKLATIAANNWIANFNGLSKNVHNTTLNSQSTLESAFNEFLDHYKTLPHIKPSTVKIRESSFKQIKEDVSQISLSNFNLKIIQSQFDTWDKKYANSTSQSIKALLSLISDYLISINLIEYNFTRNIKLTESKEIYANDEFTDEIDTRFLEKNELQTFLQVAKENLDFKNYVICELFAFTGIRSGELCVLQWKDFVNNELYIYKTYFNDNSRTGEYQLLSPKYPKSKRKIPIPANCCKLLEEWRIIQAKEKEKSESWDNNDFIFTTFKKNGNPISPRNTLYHFEKLDKILPAQGINKKVRPHMLRHTHVSLLAQAGVPLINIKARVGHGDGDITERIYLHVTEESQEIALQKFESLFD